MTAGPNTWGRRCETPAVHTRPTKAPATAVPRCTGAAQSAAEGFTLGPKAAKLTAHTPRGRFNWLGNCTQKLAKLKLIMTAACAIEKGVAARLGPRPPPCPHSEGRRARPTASNSDRARI